jgi:flagellar protein FlgJ
MTIPATSPVATTAPSATAPTLPGTVKSMVGMLWYDMLSELNTTGYSPDALGAGGSSFQSMFLWNVAQNDFGKYDTALTAATVTQLGGHAAAAAASPAPAAPAPSSPSAPQTSATAAVAMSEETPVAAGTLLENAKNYARSVWPSITAAAQKLNVPAVALLAQSALETGWGTAAPGNNLFGVKTLDGETGTSRPTHEVVDGVMMPQTASFRDYPSPAASVSDYVQQITGGFQNVAGQTSVSGFAAALQSAGYATDNNYAAKIISISQSPMMAQVLQAVGQTPPQTTEETK